MMGAKAHTKGKRGELELVHYIRDHFGYDVKRGYVAAGEQDLIGLLGIHIEAKVWQTIDIPAWVSQAVISSEKRKDGLPVVMFRQVSKTHRGLPWLVVMRFEDWAKMNGEDYGAVYIKYGNQFRGGIYAAMNEAADAGAETLHFERSGLKLCCMYIDDWFDLYGSLDLPFTEE